MIVYSAFCLANQVKWYYTCLFEFIIYPKPNSMKTKLVVVIWLIALFVNTGCTHRVVIVKRTPDHRLPPGQAKKITGSQSAKPYAPGQQKKKG